MTPPLFICFFNQLFTGIVGCGLTSRGNGADFGILRMDFGRCEQVPDMRSSYSSGAHPRGTS
ncbi:hypothetical protein [Klebsiella pneumoniae]|uniref:hypothetical protein n=1 Tax=Klebsiella pneumoniae TaxID=573 RepID=UPI0009833A66|nr:hypothetical protein [Klebsiella pneumoniae]